MTIFDFREEKYIKIKRSSNGPLQKSESCIPLFSFADMM